MKKIYYLFSVLFLVFSISSCAILPWGATTNEEKADTQTSSLQASFVLRKERITNRLKEKCLSTNISEPKKQEDVLVLLALSGGGSRAAYFSALAMREMEKIQLNIVGKDGRNIESNVLHEIDVISSVSGGSLAAGYYAMSHDPGNECASPSNRLWGDIEIRDHMTKDYIFPWIINMFNPIKIVLFWLSNYDRTDIMSQTFTDNLFDVKDKGLKGNVNSEENVFSLKWNDLKLGELNELRPNLILNATSGTRNNNDFPFGKVFTFTDEDFTLICSNIKNYSLGRAVMATASFPGVFNYMTLENHKGHCPINSEEIQEKQEKRYLHVFDGGNSDNLGLTSIKRVIWKSLLNHSDYKMPLVTHKKIIVILVDAFTNSRGVDPREADPRELSDYIVDSNFIDATDSLLKISRERLLERFIKKSIFPATKNAGRTECDEFLNGEDKESCKMKEDCYWEKLNNEVEKKLEFVHLKFDEVGDVIEKCKNKNCLRKQLHRIPTNFKFKSRDNSRTKLSDNDAIACAVPSLFHNSETLKEINPKYCGNLELTANINFLEKWRTVKHILENPDK